MGADGLQNGTMSQAGGDVVVRPGPGVRRGLRIPAAELEERFSRSSGPGGQGVNTTDSRVELLFEPETSNALTETQRSRIQAALADRIVNGRISIVASEHRAQRRNRVAARERLAALLRTALAPEPPRRKGTRPTRGSQRRRLAAKKRRSEVKAGRGRISRD